jgi:hypothetical protein
MNMDIIEGRALLGVFVRGNQPSHVCSVFLLLIVRSQIRHKRKRKSLSKLYKRKKEATYLVFINI